MRVQCNTRFTSACLKMTDLSGFTPQASKEAAIILYTIITTTKSALAYPCSKLVLKVCVWRTWNCGATVLHHMAPSWHAGLRLNTALGHGLRPYLLHPAEGLPN